MNDLRTRSLIPRPSLPRKRPPAPSKRKRLRSLVPVATATLAIALALFSLPSALAVDLKIAQNARPAKSFPVTVRPDDKTIVEDPQVEQLLSVKPTTLSAASGLAKGVFTWLATAISNLDAYRQIAGAAGVNNLFVTIPAGARAEEVADLFGNRLKWTAKQRVEFLAAARADDPKLHDGQFVPGTYFVSVTNPVDVASTTHVRFETDILSRYGTTTEEQVPLEDALTIASMIQREAGGWNDMRLISGIMWNRLFKGMPLQIDATMQYAKASKNGGKGGWWPTPLPEDKNIKSAYNTYRQAGLPPGPIAEPSLAAILAALNPKKTNCIFYFHDRFGRFHCSPTYEGHVTLLKKYYGQGK